MLHFSSHKVDNKMRNKKYNVQTHLWINVIQKSKEGFFFVIKLHVNVHKTVEAAIELKKS